MLDKLSVDHFSAHVDQSFSMSLAEDQFEMTLIRASLSRHQPFDDPKKRKAFSLFFRPLDDRKYPQATYVIEHPEIEEPLNIFMSPVMGDEPGSFVMQAVFS